jgi:hypothetical protein
MLRKIVLIALVLAPQLASAQVRWLKGTKVTIAAPAPKVEVIPPAPSARHQWVAGYWAWRNSAKVWVPGRWCVPPSAGYVWEPARWEGGMFYDGHWRASEQLDATTVYQPPAPPVQEVVADAPPPLPLEEVQGNAPYEQATWIPGYWHWAGGHHEWVAGRWSPEPKGFVWAHHEWEKRPDGKFVVHPGHWHRR